MVAKFDKYWSEVQGPMGIAIILDPRFKSLALLMCFEKLLGTTGKECEEKVDDVKILLAQLMREYNVEVDKDTTESSTPSLGSKDDFFSYLSAHAARRRPVGTELDRYLDDDLVDIHTKNFDVLDWWKLAGTRLPVLRRIA